jgi:hypothetical protein
MALGPILSVALLAAAASEPAELDAAELAARAEAAFAEGVRLRDDGEQARPHFRQAAAGLDELNRRGVRNPALFRSLGNAHLLADELPQAILAYRRGLRLAPGDASLQAGLAAARERVEYAPGSSLGKPMPEDHPPWLPRPSPRTLFLSAAGLYGAGWLCLGRWLMARRGRTLFLGLLALAGAAALGVGLVVLVRGERAEAVAPLVVVAADGVPLRLGDGPSYPSRFDAPLNRGVEARLRVERDGWLQIELSGGEIGWVPRDRVLIDR